MMIMKKIVSFLLFTLIFSFIGALLSSFLLPSDVIVQLDAESLSEFFRDNWALIALILSEVAAILPAKPKGIIQAFIFIIDKVINKTNVKRKIIKS